MNTTISTMDSMYENNWDHLSDELYYLDLLLNSKCLERATLNHSSQQNDNNQTFDLAGILESEVQHFFHQQFYRHTPVSDISQAIQQQTTRLSVKRLASATNDNILMLPTLTRLFGLDRFEEQCIVLCLAAAINPQYKKVFAYLQDDLSQDSASIYLIAQVLLTEELERAQAKKYFVNNTPLIQNRLLTFSELDNPEVTHRINSKIHLNDRIVNFLLEINAVDDFINSVVRLEPNYQNITNEYKQGDSETSLLALLTRKPTQKQILQNQYIHIWGKYGSGKYRLAKAISATCSLPLLCLDAQKLVEEKYDYEKFVLSLLREVKLQNAVLCIESFGVLQSHQDSLYFIKTLVKAIQHYAPLTILLLGDQSWEPMGFLDGSFFISHSCNPLSSKERCQSWVEELEKTQHIVGDTDIRELSSKYQFSTGQIRDAMQTAKNLSRIQPVNNVESIDISHLNIACSRHSITNLKNLSKKIDVQYCWNDIVLPNDQLQQLREISEHVRNRNTVLEDWDFKTRLSYGRGITALFTGPSGTGKTMSAEVIANDLALSLFKIDLSTVVSKYIGETEKNLHKIFEEAEYSNAILFFDEADALFGKRSEVKDAHDRYANIETAYLLQKIEEYPGVVILATNFRRNIDDAFTRRLNFIIDFPFPDEFHREKIWQLSFPDKAPVSVDVDFLFLSKKLRIAGGNIKNISLRSAHLAASECNIIKMRHILQSARRELQKMGKHCAEFEFSN